MEEHKLQICTGEFSFKKLHKVAENYGKTVHSPYLCVETQERLSKKEKVDSLMELKPKWNYELVQGCQVRYVPIGFSNSNIQNDTANTV